MSEPQAAPKKPSFWQTLRTGWVPYKRLYGYVKPYRWRFIAGLALGFAFGVISNGAMPLVIGKVTGAVFQGGTPTAQQFVSDHGILEKGPGIKGILLTCLLIPLVMGARSLCGYGNAVMMQWVSNRVVTDVRNELFVKMVRHSMDFFNKMRSGFLMSRITNDTRGMQMALSTISSDLFKQPVAIMSGIVVLLYMDWKFTLVTLVLFPVCLVPIVLYGRKARKSAQYQYEDLGQMVMTMQETFSGIRAIKSFAREKHQQESFVRSNQLLFDHVMRIVRAMEKTGPIVELLAACGVGLALLYIYFANLSAARFIALNAGIFLLYDPIKTLSRLHIVMQQSIQATTEIFGILDSESSVQDAPDAKPLTRCHGLIEFDDVTFRYANAVTNAV